jgi:hypothetical protein
MLNLPAAKFIIFTKTCDNARKLALMLRIVGLPALPLHGQMTQHKRQGAINKFKAAKESMLFATGENSTCGIGFRQACVGALSLRYCLVNSACGRCMDCQCWGATHTFDVRMCTHPRIFVVCVFLNSVFPACAI